MREVRRRALYIAYRLGKLPELRRRDPAVIREVAAGFEFYWELFNEPDFFIQPVMSYHPD